MSHGKIQLLYCSYCGSGRLQAGESRKVGTRLLIIKLMIVIVFDEHILIMEYVCKSTERTI